MKRYWRLRHMEPSIRALLKQPCTIDGCKTKSETQIGTDDGDFKGYCWEHAYMQIAVWAKNHLEMVKSQELWNRIPDNCYKCADLKHENQNLEFLLAGVKMKLTESYSHATVVRASLPESPQLGVESDPVSSIQ